MGSSVGEWGHRRWRPWRLQKTLVTPDSLRAPTTWVASLRRPTRVTSRRGDHPESRLARQHPKRARRRGRDAQSSITPSTTRSLTQSTCSLTLNTSPLAAWWLGRAVWLVNRMAGCVWLSHLPIWDAYSWSNWNAHTHTELPWGLREANSRTEISSSILTSLGYVTSWLSVRLNWNMCGQKRDTLVQEELLAHVRLHSSEAKDWKSGVIRVVSEAAQALVRESAEAEAQGSHGQAI